MGKVFGLARKVVARLTLGCGLRFTVRLHNKLCLHHVDQDQGRKKNEKRRAGRPPTDGSKHTEVNI